MGLPVAGFADPARVRQWLTLSFVIYLVALVAGSAPRAVGDGGEYLAMSLNLGETGRPWMTDADVTRLQAETASVPALESWDIRTSLKTSPLYGTHDFVHFWFYSAAAQPFVSLARAVGASPLYGFAALNVGLLVLAFWVALPRLGGWLTWLVFAGPVIWWADKAHTEPFTFALLIVAVLLLEEAPVWAVVAAGVAATQNPPMLAMVPFAAVALGSRSTSALRRPAVWIGLIGALAIACSAVVYYEIRYRTASLLLSATLKETPGVDAFLATPFDTNLGIVAAFPFYVVALAVAIVVTVLHPRRLTTPAVVLAFAMTPVFLMSFAQTSNMHHGGTPGMSRYVLWLVPLGVPFLRELFLHASETLKTGTAIVAIVSATISTFIFHPKHPDNYREPTWLATLMWTRYPAWTNPAPEIFVDVNDPRGGERLPVATNGCTKALLIGRGDSQGMWPVPCYPADVPAECRTAGALCYANAARLGYTFRADLGCARGAVQVRPRPHVATVHGARGAAGDGRRGLDQADAAGWCGRLGRASAGRHRCTAFARSRRSVTAGADGHTRGRAARASAPAQDVCGVHRPGDRRRVAGAGVRGPGERALAPAGAGG